MKGEAGGGLSEDSVIVRRNFEIAVQLVKSLPQKGTFQSSYAEAGKIYSYFKQSKFGPCTQPRPGFWDVVNRAKWDAWSALRDMPQEEAMKSYVEEIKKIYYRFKESDEFEERQDEFTDTLIPFLQATGLQLTPKLMKVVKDRTPKIEETKEENKITQPNGYIKKDDVSNSVNEDEQPDVSKTGSDKEHSLPMEDLATSPKVVSFKVNGENKSVDEAKAQEDQGGNNSDTSNDSEEDEVYCDSLDPDQVIGLREEANDSDFDLTHVTRTDSIVYTPEQQKLPIHQETSTPYNKEPKTSSTDSKSDFELVEKISDSKKKVQGGRKRETDKQNSSLEGFDILQEFHKPHSKNTCLRKSTHSTLSKHEIHNGYHEAGIRSHKGQGHSSSQHPTSASSTRSQYPSRSVNGNSEQYQSTRYQHRTRARHSSGSNHGGSEDETSSTVSSCNSDNVGLKIVQALERMEENMHLVLDRLDSIEGSIKVLTKPVTPWWKNYVPSRAVLIWTLWPIVVNLLFYYFWSRRRRQKLRKC